MSITPLDLEPVGPYKSNADGPDAGRHSCGVEQRLAAHLLDTRRTGACQAEGAGGIEALMAVLVPLDVQTIVLTIDGVRDGVLHVVIRGETYGNYEL